jgi:hypothetical protein
MERHNEHENYCREKESQLLLARDAIDEPTLSSHWRWFLSSSGAVALASAATAALCFADNASQNMSSHVPLALLSVAALSATPIALAFARFNSLLQIAAQRRGALDWQICEFRQRKTNSSRAFDEWPESFRDATLAALDDERQLLQRVLDAWQQRVGGRLVDEGERNESVLRVGRVHVSSLEYNVDDGRLGVLYHVVGTAGSMPIAAGLFCQFDMDTVEHAQPLSAVVAFPQLSERTDDLLRRVAEQPDL